MARVETIITNFELQVSDVTELSTSEELMVLNRVYNKVCDARPWEFLKTQASGSILSDATSSYITLPTNFNYFSENNQYTDNSISPQNNASPRVVFVGTNYSPYQVVNFGDRRQYRNQDGYCYLDLAGGKIRFFVTPQQSTYEFDYIKIPTALVAGADPETPARFDDIYEYAMAVEDSILQLSPKATSYKDENERLYANRMADMAYYNANLLNN